jgi:hypothetical protein
MAREVPVGVHLPRQSADLRGIRASPAPPQGARCLGAAAQLAAVRRVLRHGPAFQLEAGGATPAARAPADNRTGLPDRLKSGIEALSGISLDAVKVHYNSSKPAQLNALAYAQGSDIQLAPGQEKHLPHEAWHVVQQAQGRVRPTMRMKSGIPINNDEALEREAEAKGRAAIETVIGPGPLQFRQGGFHMASCGAPIQMFMDPESIKADKAETVAADTKEAVEYIRKYGKAVKNYPKLLEQKVGVKADTSPVYAALATGPLLDAILKTLPPDPQLTLEDVPKLREIIRSLNVIENDFRTHEIAYRDVESTVKIGTEFTFTNALLGTLPMKKKEESAPLIDNWVALVMAKSRWEPTSKKAQGKVKYPDKATTFEYRLKDGTAWSWTLDFDEACLETQTEPITSQELFGEIGEIIDTHIFGSATKLGLVPGGGGGHISLDAATMFDGSGEHFLSLLLVLQNSAEHWQKFFKTNAEGDVLNAMWIGEGGQGQKDLKAFNDQAEELLRQVVGGSMDFYAAAQEIQNIHATLPNPVAAEYKKSKDPQKVLTADLVTMEAGHYHAANVEHLTPEEAQAGSARLELRRIDAQKNVADLQKHLSFIFALIAAAREKARTAQTARHSPSAAAAEKG